MKSVVIISTSNNEISSLLSQWKNRAKSIGIEKEKLNIVIGKERIYIDYIENGVVDYDGKELEQIDIQTPYFYLVCYSNRDEMKYFIQNSEFAEGSYIDNDFGRIVPIDSLKQEEILSFIE